jgi:hypothetical protein
MRIGALLRLSSLTLFAAALLGPRGAMYAAAPQSGSSAEHAHQTITLSDGLDPAKWPGKMPEEAAKAVQPLFKQLPAAQNAHDAVKIAALVTELRKRLGRFAGAPEVKPEYAAPIETGLVDLPRAEALCEKLFAKHRGRNGWEVSVRAKAAGEVQQRLRVSFRTAASDLRLFEAGLPGAQQYRDTGLAGFNYIAGQQTSVGVFGYPYNPKATSGVQATMLRMVREGEKRGLKMIDGDWCIEDLAEGGLQFDNGEAGAGLLYAYALCGDRRFVDAARRAADWAAGRNLVANWNYNSFSGWLLARLYRVTGEQKYLEAAKVKFDFGVLPGQMENGRWFDPHNARPQYHALMARNLVEYALALRQAADPRAEEVVCHTRLALDSMAEETIRYGASNVEEGLPLEALAVGLIAFGAHPRWEQAADIYANCLLNHLLPQLLAENKSGGPETLSAYLLWRKVRDGKTSSHEVQIFE